MLPDVIQRMNRYITFADDHNVPADIFPIPDGSGLFTFYLYTPKGIKHDIDVLVRVDGKYDVHVCRTTLNNAVHIMSAENFSDDEAIEMVDSWIDTVRSGRADPKPQSITLNIRNLGQTAVTFSSNRPPDDRNRFAQ